jgi:hypothetical protein
MSWLSSQKDENLIPTFVLRQSHKKHRGSPRAPPCDGAMKRNSGEACQKLTTRSAEAEMVQLECI